MTLIKKNIWTLFFIILFFSSSILIILFFKLYKDIKDEYSSQNENIAKHVATSTENYFDQLNIILKILEENLLENETYKDPIKAKELFKKHIKKHDSLIAFSLIKPDGNYILTELDVPAENIPNILSRKEARKSFLKVLKTNSVIIGRTYYLPEINRTIIPIRKTIFNKENKPVAVIAVVLPSSNPKLLNKNLLSGSSNIIELFRDMDRYRQVYIFKDKKDNLNDIYNTTISLEKYKSVVKSMENTYKTSFEDIRNSGKVVSVTLVNEQNKYKYLLATTFIKNYQLWASSYIRYDEINAKLIKTFSLYFTIYLIGIITIWWLFRVIARAEEEKRAQLEYNANHDELTDLPNRYYLKNHIKPWIDKKEFSLIYIDLDNFKYINDTLGHNFGDEVLKELTIKLKKSIYKDDLLIRQGGDEFLIFTKEVLEIEKFCEQLIELFNIPLNIKGSQIVVNASLGIASFPKDAKKIDSLIICSDIECYEAKKLRNTYKIFEDELKVKHYETIEIEKELKQALKNNEISLVYQPQINYDNSVYGFETLVRWNNEKLGNVRPDKFIEIAENIGLMPKIGEFIMDKALGEIKGLQNKLNKQFQLSINVSVTQFMEKDFLDKVIKKVNKHNMNPKLITLEITESVLINNIDYMISLLTSLRQKGFTISMDDFGTGYSSLSMLRSVPINELKIDKAFIDDINKDKTARDLVKSIIEMSEVLKFNTVLAEGIENKEQVELLNKFGCTTYQGYYYSKPLDLKSLEKFLL